MKQLLHWFSHFAGYVGEYYADAVVKGHDVTMRRHLCCEAQQITAHDVFTCRACREGRRLSARLEIEGEIRS